MFDTKDILARLQNGETIDSIAAEMTAVLNEANDAYEAANAKATHDAVLEAAAANVVSSLLDYTNLVCPELIEDITEDDEATLVSLLVSEADNLAKFAQLAISLGELYEEPKVCCGKTDCKHCAPTKVEMTTEDAIAEFLKKNFLS